MTQVAGHMPNKQGLEFIAHHELCIFKEAGKLLNFEMYGVWWKEKKNFF
jgi:hypothetical protein